MSRIIGLISWYDERPDWLAGLVASLSKCADHVVAVDGAYFLYPEGRRVSTSGQAEAIRETARSLDMGCTIHEPQRVWAGNEVEKRQALFTLGEAVSEPEDWYFHIDGDELVTDVGTDLRRECAAAGARGLIAGEVNLWRYRDHYKPDERPFVTALREEQPSRQLFKAERGIRVTRNHYTYHTPDGRMLRGDSPSDEAADFSFVAVQHRHGERDLWRNHNADGYYKRREELGIETRTDGSPHG